MDTTFIKAGLKVYVDKTLPGTKSVKLDPKIYSIEHSRDEGFFLLNIGEKYSIPDKTYGNYEEAAKRVVHTHYNKKGSTGILLTGLKGTGKSLFVKMISNIMIDLGVPIIQVNKAYNGEDLFNFVESLGNCVILFDEFGKNYTPYGGHNVPSQNSLLGLFDGLTGVKRMHLFTENQEQDISQYLINRPGRIHYHFRYNRLSNEVIKEYCKDLEIPDEVTNELIELAGIIKVLSFDVIKCIIEEWKMYGGKLADHLKDLNITTLKDQDSTKPILISYTDKDGKIVPNKEITVQVSGDCIYVDPVSRSSTGIFGGSYTDRAKFSEIISINNDIYTIKTDNEGTLVVKMNTAFN